MITNLSSGRLGAAIASALLARSVDTTLVGSRSLLSHPDWFDPRCRTISFRSFADLDRVLRCVKLGGFVNATADFKDHPEVINGASDLMVDVLGDRGRHARFAVGAGSLPRGVAVEVDAIVEISQ